MRCYVLLGGKLYYISESKAYDKLGEPGIMLHFAKHNQHALHANARGSGGIPTGKFWKIDARRLNLRAFQGQNIYTACINLKKQIILK